MFNRIRARRQDREARLAGMELLRMHQESPWPDYPTAPPESAPTHTPAAEVVDEFLPPDLRLPTRDELTGMMMPWDKPLVIDGEIRECPQCGAYRNWVLLSVRDEVWLRCHAGHETLEPRLDTAWYNRHSGPMDRWHPTLEDGLKHLGH
ncbi:hypothetical protein OG427_06980 [Streptomyces sp. NBC_00133]|uniref:hypothetical protein n=1 Tax=Streptomyces sp. NBC_00133 TaxID=2903624 RepID=UPI003251EF78